MILSNAIYLFHLTEAMFGCSVRPSVGERPLT